MGKPEEKKSGWRFCPYKPERTILSRVKNREYFYLLLLAALFFAAGFLVAVFFLAAGFFLATAFFTTFFAFLATFFTAFLAAFFFAGTDFSPPFLLS